MGRSEYYLKSAAAGRTARRAEGHFPVDTSTAVGLKLEYNVSHLGRYVARLALNFPPEWFEEPASGYPHNASWGVT